MNKTNLLPSWVLILLDLILIGAVLCSFAYFHHVRTLWGAIELDQSDKTHFTKPVSSENDDKAPSPIVKDGEYDYSGDFAKTLPEVFLKTGEAVISTDDTYISQDICMTLTEENIELYYNNKTYEVQYFVYDIYVRNVENLYTVAVPKREPITDLIDSAAELTDADGNLINDGPALAAINGDYWGNTNHTQVAVRNGEVLCTSDYISSDICVLYYDGTIETITPDEYDWEEIAAKAPYQIWQFGPGLLDDSGNAITEFPNESYDRNVISERHPRASIGYYEPGHYCFVVVDGRSDDSDGVRMFQLAEIYETLGCEVAYNLDGGDSCQAYWGDQVVRWDDQREEEGDEQRELYDIIGVGEVLK